MAIPQWLAIAIAALVMAFGGYRIWLAIGGPPDAERAKHRSGMLAMSRRTNGLVAVLYLLVGGALLASAFGWKPWSREPGAVTAPVDDGPRPALPVR
ncbi:MAG: hypothetical protein KBG48_18475 [Kofleriaceae bacterium]|jgi:hypothetical protein|nr:hypothetical protein [Kofleriaceae bacterium]MBP9169392.1 hypothetical protein [Kofleriaceae bacterium]MBP9863237.1 hypothetical protein [Kofleriaceae bacterium]